MQSQKRRMVRRLEAADVRAVLKIIEECRLEYGLEARVEAILEPADKNLLETYSDRRSAYFVATVDDKVVGGAGISGLPGTDGSICVLQRMYLHQASRGLGIGRELLRHSLQAARHLGYHHCYAETISEMTIALAFYQRQGFQALASRLGNTGHQHSDRWLLLPLHLPGGAMGM